MEQIGTLSDTPPDGAELIGAVMTNADHSIAPDATARLKAGNYVGDYPGWHFHATVWWDGANFAGHVMVHHVYVGTYRAPTLRDLMEVISDTYGWE